MDVRPGWVVRSPAEIMSRDKVIFHQHGRSPALFSDLFRYQGLKRGLGTWIDVDVFLLRNNADLGGYIFAWEEAHLINGAILRLPPDCALFAYIDKLMNAPVPFRRS